MAKSPIAWLGGKSRLASKLITLFPPHHTYVEPFGGGAWVLLAKEPSAVEVYNDLDSGLVNFFRVLRDPQQAQRLAWLSARTPHSREEYGFCRDHWQDSPSQVEQARRWFVVARQSMGKFFGQAWGLVVATSSHGQAETTATWQASVDRLPQAHERLLRVQIEHKDFRALIPAYDTPETLFYCDPPYVPATRRSGSYRHELSLEDHRVLVQLLLDLKGMAILSGYDHPVYRPLERAGWDKRQWQVTCAAAARTRASGLQGKGKVRQSQQRVECAWISPRATERRRAARGRAAQPAGLLFGDLA